MLDGVDPLTSVEGWIFYVIRMSLIAKTGLDQVINGFTPINAGSEGVCGARWQEAAVVPQAKVSLQAVPPSLSHHPPLPATTGISPYGNTHTPTRDHEFNLWSAWGEALHNAPLQGTGLKEVTQIV